MCARRMCSRRSLLHISRPAPVCVFIGPPETLRSRCIRRSALLRLATPVLALLRAYALQDTATSRVLPFPRHTLFNATRRGAA